MLCEQVLFRVALGLLRLHEARLVARTEFSALATELSLVTRSATSLRCHAFMQEVCGNTGSLPRARVNKLKATSSSLSRHSWFQLTAVLPGEVRCGGEGGAGGQGAEETGGRVRHEGRLSRPRHLMTILTCHL